MIVIPPFPETFLEIRIHEPQLPVGLTSLCAGYEGEAWRAQQLASHLIEWLPEFALSYTEREGLAAHNAYQLLVRAARSVYRTGNVNLRGEIGELLLHVSLRQVFGTIPAVSKLFFKDAANDTVKGFDAVHVISLPDTLELWLGEAKFYSDIGAAINEAVKELQRHTSRDYLRGEFAAITNKIDDSWLHADRLRQLIHPNVSLDQIFDSLCIPVLLTYESPAIAVHRAVTAEFISALREEIFKHHASFSSKALPKLRLHLFLVPLGNKNLLVESFDVKLRSLQ